MTICEHCGARVYGNVCEYCDMPVNNSVPPQKVEYKQAKHNTQKSKNKIFTKKSLSTLSFPIKKKHKKRRLKPNKRFYFTIFTVMVLCGIHNLYMNNDTDYSYPITYDEYQTISYDNLDELSFENVYAEPSEYYTNDFFKQNGIFPAGTYQIGTDFPEGTYIFIAERGNNYHGVQGVYSDSECINRISSMDGPFDGTRIVEISGDGYIDFSFSTAYNIDMHPEIINNPYYCDGMFIVGRDIDAGLYELEKTEDNAEWYIYSDSDAINPTIKDSGKIYESYDEITLENGDILELKDCIISNTYESDNAFIEEGIFPSGTYQIGTEFPEGTYIFVPDLADGQGVEGVYSDIECENQISSEYVHFDGTRIAKISGDGYVQFSWATAYNLDMHPEVINDPHKKEGMFIVGRDIEAGTYELEEYGNLSDYAEWYIYSDLNSIGPVIKVCGSLYSENATNIITLEDGDIFKLKHCIIKE